MCLNQILTKHWPQKSVVRRSSPSSAGVKTATRRKYTSEEKISVIQSTQNTAVFVGRRFGCNERGQSQARQRELGLKRHQLPLPESRASDFPMTYLQASRNTIDSNF